MPEDAAARLRGNLKRLLGEKYGGQARLAKAGKLTDGYVSLILTGKRTPKLDRVGALAEALGVPLEELFAPLDREPAQKRPNAANAVTSPVVSSPESDARPLGEDAAMEHAAGWMIRGYLTDEQEQRAFIEDLPQVIKRWKAARAREGTTEGHL